MPSFATIRDEQARLLEALTPSTLSHVRFLRERGEVDFAVWCEKNPSACFRRFRILRGELSQGPEVTTGVSETVLTETRLVVAYPKHYGLYKGGADNIRDLTDIVESDFYDIDKAIGSRCTSDVTSLPARIARTSAPETEDAGAAWLFTVTYEVEFHQAVAA